MFKGFVKTTAICFSVVLFFSDMSLDVQAYGVSSVLPNGGINVALSKGTTLENMQEDANISDIELETMIDISQSDDASETEESVETPDEKKENVVVSQAADYVNVRSTPSEDGTIIGKFYNNAVGVILSQQEGWYEIQSGSVTGYVKSEYCVAGKEAKELAAQLGVRMAQVLCDGLVVRKEASADAVVLGMVAMDDELLVTQETDDWVKVDIEEGFGWVSREFVKVYTMYTRAESKQEEKERLEKEQSKLGEEVAEYAVQFVGNPYKWGGSSLTEGTDCSGFVMKVYEHFGVELPHSSSADRKQGVAVTGGLENAKPGDLICYSGHVAIYIGDGKIVHAANEKKGIIISDANYRKILAIRRIF